MISNLNKIFSRKTEPEKSLLRSDTLTSVNSDEIEGNGSNSAEGFLCPTCYAAFPTADLLQTHYESNHSKDIASSDGKGLFTCSTCKMKLGSDIELQSHYMRHHETSKEEEEIEALRLQIQALTEGKALLQSELEMMRPHLQKVSEENERIREEKNILETRAAKMVGELENIKGNFHRVIAEKQSLELSIKEMTQKIEQLENEVRQRTEQMETCSSELEERKAENQQLKLKRETLFAQIEEGDGANAAIIQLKDETERLREQLIFQQGKHAHDLQDCQEKILALEDTLAAAKAEHHMVSEQKQDLERLFADARNKLEALSVEKQNLSEHIRIERGKYEEKGRLQNEKIKHLETTLSNSESTLQAKLSLAQSELKELDAKCSAMEQISKKNSAELTTRCSELLMSISSMNEELVQREQKISDLENDLKKHVGDIRNEKEQNTKLTSQLQKVEELLEEATARHNNMVNEVLNHEAITKEYELKAQSSNEEILKNKDTIKIMSDELEQLRSNLLNKTSEFSHKYETLNSQVTSLKNEKESLAAQLVTTKKHAEEKTSQYEKLKVELNDLRDSHRKEKENREKIACDLEDAKQLIVSQKQSFQNEMETLKEQSSKQVSSLKMCLKDLEVEINRLKTENGELSSKLVATESRTQKDKEEFKKVETRYQAQLGVLTENAETLQEDLSSKQNQVQKLETKLDEIGGAKLELEAKFENALQERKELLDRCLRNEGEKENLVKNNAELRRKLDDSIAALHELGRENQSLQTENMRHQGRKWADDAVVTHCTACGKLFTVTVRKHHCRNCGDIFCNECSSKTATVASSKKPVRVCDVCSVELSK